MYKRHNSLIHSAINIWNHILQHIPNSNNFKIFIRLYKQILIDSYLQ